MMEAKEANHPSFNPLSSRSTNSEEQKDEEGGQEQDISAHDGRESDSEVSLCSTPVLSSFASYDMADRRFECEVDEIPDFDYLSLSSRWISRKDVFGSNSSSWRSTSAVTGRREEENHIEISHPLRLAQRIRNAADEAKIFKEECLVLAKLSDEVSDHLRSISQLVVSNRYLSNCHGLDQVQVNCTASLKLALELLLGCGSSKINKIDSKDFHKPTYHLEFTKEHLKGLVSICLAFASNKVPEIPLNVGDILSWLETQIPVVNVDGSKHNDYYVVPNVLRDLARENEKSKQLIVNEGAVLALLRSTSSVTGRREEENHIEISHPLRLAQRIRIAAHEAEVFKGECFVLAMLSDEVSDHLRSISQLVVSNRYLSNCHGLDQVQVNCTASLKLALELLLRCGRSQITRLRRITNKINSNDFQMPTYHIESTIKPVKWLFYIFSVIVSNVVLNSELVVGSIISYWLQTQISALNADDSKHYDCVTVANVFAKEYKKNKQLIMNKGAIPDRLLMIVENVEVDTKLRNEVIQILESLIESTYAPDAGEVMTILVRQLNDKNKNFVAEVVQLLMLLNLVEMQNTRKIYLTIRNFKGGALFERLVDLEEFQPHLVNFFQM